jgi:hypothetical protein
MQIDRKLRLVPCPPLRLVEHGDVISCVIIDLPSVDGIEQSAVSEDHIERVMCVQHGTSRVHHSIDPFLVDVHCRDIRGLPLFRAFRADRVEMQRARDELRMSENRASRPLLDLRQNVKLLTHVAAQEWETTIVQEAAQDVANVSELDCPISPTYLKQLGQVLSGSGGRPTGLEVLELLTQEISIPSVLRRRTTKLFEMSTCLTQTMADQLSRHIPQLIERHQKANEHPQKMSILRPQKRFQGPQK